MRQRRELEVMDGRALVRPDTQPRAVTMAGSRREDLEVLQFDRRLPDDVMSAMARVVEHRPDIGIYAYSQAPSDLRWLTRFPHVRSLSINLWDVSSFDPIGELRELRSLTLHRTSSARLSLAFLTRLPLLEHLYVEGHARDFGALQHLTSLRRLELHGSRAETLEALRDHAALRLLTINFGRVRDLEVLATLPALAGLEVYGVRELEDSHLDFLREVPRLEALSLGAQRRITRLTPLAGRPHDTLRFLNLEGLTQLQTLDDMAPLVALEQLGLWNTRTADRRLQPLLALPRLRHVIIDGVYPESQVAEMRANFAGVLHYRSSADPSFDQLAVRWRTSVAHALGEPRQGLGRVFSPEP